MALARRVQQDARPDLKLVVMSATLDTAAIARWLGDAPVVESEGRLFPVAIEHAEREDQRPLHVQVAGGVGRAVERTDGDVLVFLPGVGEIRRARSELEGLAQRRGADLVELYGDLALEDQDRALRKGARRRIVLATNVAETSVTVEGVTAVVDSGLARVARIDGPMTVRIAGSGSVAVQGGRADKFTATIDGSGAVFHEGTAVAPTLRLYGSPTVRLGAVEGRVTRFGHGEVFIDGKLVSKP